MKLTRKLETEILKAYNEYWNAYLKGDMRTMSYWMHDNIQMIGSGRGEFFNNKKKTIKYYRSTAGQVTGKADMRNRKITVLPVGDEILVNEECDFYVLIGSVWTFYGEGRISTLFTETNKGWKIIQEHGSMPDARTSEGEQVNTDKIKAENVRLKDAVKRRTIELEEKNRELEIETALEKVRARTMAMQKSNELPETTFLLFQQLKELGETAAQLSIGIVKEEEGFVELSATVHGNTMPLTYLIPTDEPFMMKKAVKAWKAKKRSLTIELKGKELKDYNKWRNSVLKKKIIFPEKQWIVNVVFFSKGLLSFSSDKEISKETFQLLKRFAAVFDLTYTRFLDLKKAEAQAREAEIELALERVRAKTMSMQKSDELKETTLVLFQQFKSLGATTAQVSICIFDEKAEKGEMFVTLKGEKIDRSFPMNLEEESFVMKRAKGAFLNKQKTFSITIKGKELQEYNHWRNLLIGKKGWDESVAVRKQSWYVNAVFFSRGMMGISSDSPPSDEALRLLERFGNVFDLTFTRFLDLQKAEAQAREAQIEAALERVRASSMAMHHSHDMHEVINVVNEQLHQLGFRLDATNFVTDFEEGNGFNMWLATPGEVVPFQIQVPHFEHSTFQWIANEIQNGKNFMTYTLTFEQKNDFFIHLLENTEAKNISKQTKKKAYAGKGMAATAIVLQKVILTVLNYDIIPYNEDENAIIKRFGKVFEQSYTRFLDLQKAEAQAREAQIEASLERVRAKTMAMHKSPDMLEVVKILGEQFELLDFKFNSVNFNIDTHEKDWNLWLYNVGSAMYPGKIHVPYIDHPCFNRPNEAFKKGGDLHSFIFTKKEKDSFFDHIYTNTVAKYGSEERKRFTYAAPGFAMSTAVTKNTRITISNFKGEPFSEDENAILRRFANVFEQSYTRFLDLQKAEAQAREAQIETALERIRARTMAMQKSDELKEVIQLVYEQFVQLKINVEHTGFIIDYKEREDLHIWLADQHLVPSEVFVPYFDCSPNNSIKEAKEKGKDFFKYLLAFEEKNKFYRDLFKLIPDVPEETLKYYLTCPGLAGSGVLLENIGLYIENFSGTPYTEEENNTLMRFGKVFQQTYTRFLDLQKAEAQARESQIQLALERVRARTMAMQKSEEFSEAVFILFNQFKELGESPDQATIGIINEKDWVIEYWVTMYGNQMDKVFKFSIDEPNVTNRIYKAWKEEKKSLVIDLSGKELYEFTHYRESKGGAKYNPQEKRRIFNIAFFSKGLLIVQSNEVRSEESIYLLERFATVFEQTYTRFLDLQNAEAQAKEAQIEAALEKVRSRSLAMHISDELLEVVHTVFEKLKELNVDFYTVIVVIFQENSKDIFWWMQNIVNQTYSKVLISYADIPYLKDLFEAKENGNELLSKCYLGKEKNEFYNYLLQQTDLKYVAENQKKFLLESEFAGVSVAISKNTAIHITSYSKRSFSAEENEVLKRFAKVFEQAYIRFMDLQKAEAQARESQIQLALERVRARTMAMQKSDELGEAASLLFKQINDLGIQTWTSGFNIWQRDNNSFIGYNPTPSGGIAAPYIIPAKEDPFFITISQAKEAGEDFIVYEWKDKLLAETYRYMKTLPIVKEVLKGIEDSGFQLPTFQINHCAFFAQGFLLFITLEPYPEAHNIFRRFAKVFEQTYTRFLDLQKAEAQAREAQIEAALERVRSRTMAMHQTSELQEVIHTVHKELLNLNLSIDGGSFVVINDDVGPALRCWGSGGTANTSEEVTVPDFNMPFCTNLVKGIKSGPGFFTEEFSQEEKKKYFNKLFEQKPWSDLASEEKEKTISSAGGYTRSAAVSKHTTIFIINHNGRKFTEDENDILKRFAKVFEQTYTRFLDLKKAEEQAREATIEASLERVRARAMAMHKTNELLEAGQLLYKELTGLGIKSLSVTYSIMAEDEKSAFYYGINPVDGKVGENPMVFPHTETEVMREILLAWKKQESIHSIELDEAATLKHQTYVGEHILAGIEKYKLNIPFSVEAFLEVSPKKAFINTFNFKQGYLFIIGDAPLSSEQQQILLRFTKVFELTYRRFLDLQQAEAQAREAQIEAGLERVRSRGMAMQTSEELAQLIGTLFTELTKLDLVLTRCVIWIIDPKTNDAVWWMANSEDPSRPMNYSIPYHEEPPWLAFINAWKKRTLKWVYDLKGQIKKDWDDHLFSKTGLVKMPGFIRDAMKAPERVLLSASFNNFGGMNVASLEPLSDEHFTILLRFAKVFDLTYTRFNDLKQAEAQAREATIEAALERVRGKAMAMHNSADISTTASTIFSEIQKLGITSSRCGVGLLSKNNRYARMYAATVSGENNSLALIGEVELAGHSCYDNQYEAFLTGTDYFGVLEKDELRSYYEAFRKKFPGLPTDVNKYEREYCYYLSFTEGILYSWSEKPYSENQINILNRFRSIIDLTFRRYIELQKSEANAKEAVKQAALDRIRADIASMRTMSDLERITPLIWNELTTLNVPFIRCGVFIMDESQQFIHTFLSTPDGKAIAAFHIPYDTPGNIAQVLSHWREKNTYISHWGEVDFTGIADILVKQGAVASKEQYLNTLPKGGFHLHFLPFLQGMLYVGNTNELDVEQIELLQHVASAFSTAYARYEDFNKLEAAKKQVDSTLNELQATQKQLIQSEKMASLGELTAGIAHEIQNPLNFVNNFSEVSNELIEEMNTEIDKGDIEEAKVIANDIKQNLEKINHHGKRADAIVKGMLQHSRSSTGQKELTDINALADEYLRLSYHGLRAKDKTFNAKFETVCDSTIGKIYIVPQDIGRVILNLINNAFYAVAEKKKQNTNGYEPSVTVSTKKIGDKIELRVTDNGNGIPPKVLDKIFQPFFTTKPTGQGTGLGLSLSYDIITKGHGGELKVETREGEGSEFIIHLPVV